MPHLKRPFHTVIVLLALLTVSCAQDHTEEFDKMLNAQFPTAQPGATALVAIDGEIVYHKGFGMANMELDVLMQADMVFEIGSISKQFTAVAILILMEQDKLDLDDDITKFIPDYPTDDKHISVHHLLTHTSGIKSYTNMEAWRPLVRKDFEPLELIDFFKNEPMNFAPGESRKYSNSGYIILGYIIEKLSGQTYAGFIKTQIFEPLGMQASCYGSRSKLVKKRAYGYQEREGLINADYLSMTQPYAAGSLMSTVGDLFIWNRAIRSHKLISEKSLKLAFENHKLNDGKNTNYGYGWHQNDVSGSLSIEHAGGTFGYVTNAIYLPDEDVFVAVFVNCNCTSPAEVSTKMAAIAIESPYPELGDAISLDNKQLEKWVGEYNFDDGSSRSITREDNQLYSQRTGSGKHKIYPISENLFFFEGGFVKIEFEEDGDKTKALFMHRMDKFVGVKE